MTAAEIFAQFQTHCGKCADCEKAFAAFRKDNDRPKAYDDTCREGRAFLMAYRKAIQGIA